MPVSRAPNELATWHGRGQVICHCWICASYGEVGQCDVEGCNSPAVAEAYWGIGMCHMHYVTQGRMWRGVAIRARAKG